MSYSPSLIKLTNIRHRKPVAPLDAFALWITRQVGTIGFFSMILLWTVFWLAWNILAPPTLRFDPYPAFALWLFLSNMLQIFLMPLLMIGQNLDAKHSEARAEANLALNIKAEHEIERMLTHLHHHNQLLLHLIEEHQARYRETIQHINHLDHNTWSEDMQALSPTTRSTL